MLKIILFRCLLSVRLKSLIAERDSCEDTRAVPIIGELYERYPSKERELQASQMQRFIFIHF